MMMKKERMFERFSSLTFISEQPAAKHMRYLIFYA